MDNDLIEMMQKDLREHLAAAKRYLEADNIQPARADFHLGVAKLIQKDIQNMRDEREYRRIVAKENEGEELTADEDEFQYHYRKKLDEMFD